MRGADSAFLIGTRLGMVLQHLRQLPGYAPLGRVAVALYDPARDMVCSYAHAGRGGGILDHAEYPLSEVPSLALLAAAGQPRVIDDLGAAGDGGSPQVKALRQAGFRSSLTIPVYRDDQLQAFIFFNAAADGFFLPEVVRVLLPMARDLAGLVRRHALVA